MYKFNMKRVEAFAFFGNFHDLKVIKILKTKW